MIAPAAFPSTSDASATPADTTSATSRIPDASVSTEFAASSLADQPLSLAALNTALAPVSDALAALQAQPASANPSADSASANDAPDSPDTLAALAALHEARLNAAAAIARLQRSHARSPLTDGVCNVATDLLRTPAANFPAQADATAAAKPLVFAGWPGWLACAFLAPAWQTTGLPVLDGVPTWLWPVYTRYLFTAPAFFTNAAQEAQWSAHVLVHLEPVVRMLEANRGSAALQAVAQVLRECADHWVPAGSPAQLRRQQELTGRLLAIVAPRFGALRNELSTVPANERVIAVGIVVEKFSTGAGIFEGDRLRTLLDPERFDVRFFTLTTDADSFPPLHVETLPTDLENQVHALRNAQLDVVIFANDLTSAASPLTALAAHRLAPCQCATTLGSLATGLPEIDLLLAGADIDVSNFSRRAALLPAPLAFQPLAEPAADEALPTRADFGLPEDAIILAASVAPASITPELRAQWLQLLAATPRTRLLLLPGASGTGLDLLFAGLDRVLHNRLIIAGNSPLPAHQALAVLRLADVYLDGGRASDPTALHLALSAHLPIVATIDTPAAALLNVAGYRDDLAADAADYGERAHVLIADTSIRLHQRARIADKLAARPALLDPLSYADALASVLTSAVTEIQLHGTNHFRRQPTPLRPEAGVYPNSTDNLHARGKDFFVNGRADRATLYLLAAVEDAAAGPKVWHDLALALHANFQFPEAIQALESCVRSDPSQLDSWLLLADWATDLGHQELIQEISEVVKSLAPADPRVADLVARFAV